MKMKRLLALALSVCMLLSLLTTGLVAYAQQSSDEGELAFEKLDAADVAVDLKQNTGAQLHLNEPEIDAAQSVKVLILMDADAVLEADSKAVLNAETQATIKKLEAGQAKVIEQIETQALKGAKLEVSYNYTWLLNGVAAQVPYGTIAEIEAVDGVDRVLLQPVYEVCTTESVATPNTVSDGVMIGRETAWAQGYTGEGMKIAVVDTGLDTDHQNFAPLGEDKLTDTSATADTVADVLADLNASARLTGLTVDDVYYSTKVAFGFNYCDSDLDITHDNDSMGDHGTHVAGIAAANKAEGSDVTGVAPDAQLYIMKVFGKNGGAYTEDILAALEDALMLGADVVNMSLGSPAGFTTNVEEVNAIYNSVSETDTVLAVSAGNNYNSGYANNWGLDANLTENPDNGVLGSPGTYANVLTVASVENWMIQRNYIDADGYQFGYNTSSNGSDAPITSLTGEYGLVAVPGYGEEADYEGLDVTGKVVLVSRGVISFAEKHMYAEAAGAIAMLAYNNTTGEFGMDLTGSTAVIPAVAITMADGSYLVSALAENPDLTVTFPTEATAIPSESAYEMSEFSSWGGTPELTLEPDITAPGGNIYSTVNDGQYGLMSGTSMAAPNVAGMSALVLQYVKANFPAGTDYRLMAQYLLMSTAAPLTYDDETGLAYSPRSQGSGLANVYNAVTTNAYLTVDGSDTAKVSLGDDAEKTGSYSYSFNVTNFGDSAAYYDLATSAQTEGYLDYGIYFMSGTPVALSAETAECADSMVLTHDVDDDADTDSHDAYWIYRAAMGEPEKEGWESEAFRYDINGDEAVAEADVQAYLDALVGNTSDADLEATVLQVAAGETVAVSVTVTLSDDDKTYLDTYFPNGGYVEGFTVLSAKHSEGVDLSLPYMGFYGDWNAAPVLDNGSYWEYFAEDASSVVGNQYAHILFTEFGADAYGFYPGLNAYVDEPFDLEHISLSPNGDGYVDTISDMYISLLRNAASLTFRFSNEETGEVYYEATENFVNKSVYQSGYGQIVPFVYTWMETALYDFVDAEGNDLPNNTKLLLEVEAVGVGEGDEAEIWSVPIRIDTEAPELLGVKKVQDETTGQLTLELTFRDNLSTAAVALLDTTGRTAYALEGVEDSDPDENGYRNYTVSYDVTGLSGKIMILLADYALNEAYYGVNLGGDGADYGELMAYQYNVSTGSNGWVSFDTDVNMDELSLFLDDMNFVNAEYVNGFVYAQTDSGALYGFSYDAMLADTMELEVTYITQLENVYQDLAYSYAEGKLYGLFTYEDNGYPTAEVYSINLKGEYYDENMWTTVMPYQEDWCLGRGGLYGLSMAIDDAGTIYVLGPKYDWDTESVGGTATLWSVGLEYDEWSDSVMLGWAMTELGDTGLTMDYLQSMTWDHNTETLYWARFNAKGWNFECQLIEIDPTNVTVNEEGVNMIACEAVGTLSGETWALFAPLSEEAAADDDHSNVPEMDTTVVGTPILRDASLTMNVGSSKTLSYDIDPWYTAVKDVVWSSDNEDVITVDQNGTVTAVGTGSATVTVAAAADESKFDTCTVEVTALDLKLEGVLSTQGSGIGNTYGARTYTFEMTNGIASMTEGGFISAAEDLNYGLAMATTELGRGSIWACEYGNTGMIYEIDPATNEVIDVLQPVCGDMLFGMTYSEQQDTFAGIMNMYLYVDMPFTHAQEDEIQASYDEETHEFTWHKLNLLSCLIESNTGFVTNETGQGASSEIVFTGITSIDGGIKDSYGETFYNDTYKDFMGNWAYSGSVNYQPAQTLVLLDNVGRLWYIDEVTNLTKTADEWGNVTYTNEENYSEIAFYGETRPGCFELEKTDADGNVTYNFYYVRQVVETPLTNMFREGTMPRITYHFSDIEFAGYSAEGDPMFAISLYDYWNNGSTNELYLFVPGHETDELDYETWEYIRTPDRLFDLGDTGELNIIASIHSAEVTGGVDPEETEATAAVTVNPMAVGAYKPVTE